MSINFRGEGVNLPKIIKFKNNLDDSVTILKLHNVFKKIYKIQNELLYIYVMAPDESCGFVPLPDQTMGELKSIYNNNSILTIKVCEKPIFG